MKLFIKFFIIVLLTNIAFSEWELRTNYDFVRQFSSDGNKMYIGRNNGMTVYDLNTKESVNVTSLDSDLPGNYINSFMQMPDNTILISTNGGLALIENGVITKDKPICSSYPDTDARDLYKDSSGNIWTFSSHKVHKYSNGTWKTYDLSDSVTYAFDIAKLYIFGDKCWALFNDNTETQTVYYFSTMNNPYLKIGLIDDTGIITLWQTKNDFPYGKGAVSLVSLNDDVYLKNNRGIYLFHDTIWSKTTMFNIDSTTSPDNYPDLIADKNGNLWCTLLNRLGFSSYIASYNVNSGKVIGYPETIDYEYKPIVTILDDGEILAYTRNFIYYFKDTSWIKVPTSDYGISNVSFFICPTLLNGKKYIITTNQFVSFVSGTLYCLDDGSSIMPINTGFPYHTITQFGIIRDGKGIFKGRNSYEEPFKYETDSGFVKLGQNTTIKQCTNGKVYFTTYGTTKLTEWDGNNFNVIDMGFSDKQSSVIIDFDVYNEYLVSLGHYEISEDSDSLNSFLSIYNITTGQLSKYDKNNSCMPDYYYERIGGSYLIQHDTVPTAVTFDDKLNIWIYTSESLIKFNPIESKIYNIPMYDSVNKVFANTLYFDIASNELLADYYRNDKYYYFVIATEKWDSIPKSNCGIIGWFITHKKLLDNRIWACDYTGYMYRYIGKGKFAPFDLNVNGKEYLNFQISDFSIDANNYLHLGTDIGLLTNKSILTSVEDNSLIETEKFSIIPNPATDFIKINYPESMETRNIEIYSILGIIVLETEYNDKIDVSGLSAGVYFLRIADKVVQFVKL